MTREEIGNLISQMTLEEKAGMCSGADFWHLKGIERLGIPSVMVTDGPHGIRKQAEGGDHLGINESEKAVCFPAGCATAASFDRELIKRQGETIGYECQEELEYMSLEKQVTEYMPPCFLWQTATDELVPVQNSFLFAQALQEKKIPYAFHVFSKGKHGLSLADEAWANEEFGEPYTLEQTFALGQAVNDGTFPVPEEAKQALNEMAKMFTGQTKREKEQANEEVKQWPELADKWIRATL